MKTAKICLLLLAVAMLVTPVIAQTNMMVDGGFELGADGAKFPYFDPDPAYSGSVLPWYIRGTMAANETLVYWTYSSTSNSKFPALPVTPTLLPHSGNRCAYARANTGAGSTQTSITLRERYFTLTGGTVYRLEYWFKTSGLGFKSAPLTGILGEAAIENYFVRGAAYGDDWGAGNITINTATKYGTGVWKKFVFQKYQPFDCGVTDSLGAHVKIGAMLSNIKTGGQRDEMWIDDVSLTAVPFDPANAKTYYVKPAAEGGNDDNDGLSLATAWSSIDGNCALLLPGDTVKIQPGTYVGGGVDRYITGTISDCAKITSSGTPSYPITFMADGGVVNVVPARIGATPIDGGNCDSLQISGSNIIIDGLTLKGGYRGAQISGSNIEVRNCRVTERNQYVPANNGRAFDLLSGSGYYFHNNIIDTPCDGAWWLVNPNVGTSKFYNNTIYMATATPFAGETVIAIRDNGLGVNPADVIVEFKNNVVMSQEARGIEVVDNIAGVTVDSKNNVFYSTVVPRTAPYYYGCSADPTDLYDDPLLVGPDYGDFRLAKSATGAFPVYTSPAIDYGVNLGLSGTDTAPDAGAINGTPGTYVPFIPGTTYYVKPDGNDAADGLSWATAWASIDRGDSGPAPNYDTPTVKANDTVLIKEGLYVGGIGGNSSAQIMAKSGGKYKPITYKADPLNTLPVVIQNLNDIYADYALDLHGVNYLTLDGLTFSESADANGPASGGLTISGAGHTVQNCKVTGLIQGTSGWWKPAFKVLDCSDALFANNIIDSFCDNGFWVDGAGYGIKFYNNTLNMKQPGSDYAVRLGYFNGTATTIDTGMEFSNNIVVSPQAHAIWVSNAAAAYPVTHQNNIYWSLSGGTAPVFGAEDPSTPLTQDASEIWADPLFTNLAISDFSLTSGSPAVDFGLNVGLLFQGTAPDAGAIESAYTLTLPTPVTTISELATIADDTNVQFTAAMIAIDDSVIFNDGTTSYAYMGQVDAVKNLQFRGIRIDLKAGLPSFLIGNQIKVTGKLGTKNGERYIAVKTIDSVVTPGTVAKTVGATNKGANSLTNGMLVKVTGKVTSVDASSKFVYVDDGSALKDGTGATGIRISVKDLVSPLSTLPAVGNQVSYVGIVGMEQVVINSANANIKVIRPRTSTDYQLIKI